jgi:predicted nucleic acid-binding protein
MRVYLDACCANRLTGDQSQPRIRSEAESVEAILQNVRQGKADWLVSPALTQEIQRGSQIERTRGNCAFLALASETVGADYRVVDRARYLEAAWYGAFDALHLASAEAGNADVLLTTDDKFLKLAARGVGKPLIPVQNPLS